MTSKQAGLLFTEGTLHHTDDSLPIMPLTIKQDQIKQRGTIAYQSTATDCESSVHLTKY